MPGIPKLAERVIRAEREIRRLRVQMDQISAGGKVRATSIAGVIPSGNRPVEWYFNANLLGLGDELELLEGLGVWISGSFAAGRAYYEIGAYCAPPCDGGGVSGSRIEDADADTYVDVEQNPDEDKIRFGTAGVERAVLDATALALAVGLKVDTIDEQTPDAGVTVEGVLLKDSAVYPDSTDANFYLAISIFGCPFIMFDAGSDYLIYDRANNEFQFWIGGAIELKIDPLRVWVNEDLEVNGGLTVGDATPGDDFLLLKFNTSRAWQFETDGADGAAQSLALRALANDKSFNIQSIGGTKIFEVRATDAGGRIGFYSVTPVVRPAAYTITNRIDRRTLNCNEVTVDELADFVATMCHDRQQDGLAQ